MLENDNSKASCIICENNYSWHSTRDLTKHLERKHRSHFKKYLESSKKFLEVLSESSNTKPKRNRILKKYELCEICSIRELSTLKVVKSHRREKHTVGKLFCCPHCQIRKKFWNNLKIHIDFKHPEHSEKRFPCEECTKTFIGRSEVNRHMVAIHRRSLGNKEETLHKKRDQMLDAAQKLIYHKNIMNITLPE